jgi:hypothetical protein
MKIQKPTALLRYKKNWSIFILLVFLAVGFQAFFPAAFSDSRVEAATTAENKASQKAQDYCDNVALNSGGGDSEYYDPCIARYKAFYLGDEDPERKCPTGNDTQYQWCQNAAKAGRDQAAKDFSDFTKFCGVFVSNAKGGNWPNFSSLNGSNKQKAIDACNEGIKAGYVHTPGYYPANEPCKAKYKNDNTLLKACYAGESLVDSHLFTLGEIKSVAQSGNLDMTNNTSNPSNGGGGGGNNGNDGSGPDCESGDFSFNWALCPIFDGTNSVTHWIFTNLIQPLLMTNPICLDASANPTCDNTIFKIWSGFRIYGDIFLVIVLLVIVFGESIGGGMIDAYTAKKVLPRLLLAAILINLSIYIVSLAIDITNVVGGGIGQLLTAPLHNQGAFTIQPNGITQGAIAVFGAGGMLVGAFALGVTGIALLLVGLIITGAIAMIGIFVTLILRQTIILALLLISPVAFALWCLPNTQSWFKRWWDTLFQMLLVYPMIIVLFAVADVMSYVTQHNGTGGVLASIVAFMLLIIPLYLVPFTLRSSNRLMGAIHGAVSSAGKQVNAVTGRRAIGAAGQEVGKNWEATKAGNRFRGGSEFNRRGRLNRWLQGATLATPANIGFNPRRMRDRLEAARSTQISALSAEAEKSAAVQAIKGNDDLLAASIHGTGTEADARAYLQNLGQRGAELEQNIASIRQAKREVGAANFEDMAAASLAGTGTGYGGGFVEMADTINRVAGNDRARATRILASARGQAERAKRVDLYGPGFATSADTLSQLYMGDTTHEAAQERITDEVLSVKSAGEIGTARNNALTNMVPAIERRVARARANVAEAHQGGDASTIAQAEHEYKRVMAHTASMLDVAGSASPENAQLIGAILGQHTGSTVPERYEMQDGKRVAVGQRPETYADQIEALRADREFQQYRREYGSARAEAAAQAGEPPQPAPPE